MKNVTNDVLNGVKSYAWCSLMRLYLGTLVWEVVHRVENKAYLNFYWVLDHVFMEERKT